MSDPLTESKAAVDELHLTDVYKRRKSQAQYDGTHTGLAEKHVKAAIAGLTVTPPPPPPDPPPVPPPGPTVFPTFTAYAFSAKRNITVASQSDLSQAIANIQVGDLVKNASGFDVGGEFTIAKQLVGGRARIQLANVAFKGAAKGSQLPAIWLNGMRGIELLGLDVTGQGNDGIRTDDVVDSLIQAKIHDCAGNGATIRGITKPVNSLEMWLEVTNCGRDLSLDPHPEKGTGNHGVNIGTGTGQPVQGKFVIDCYAQPTGAALEVEYLQNAHVWVRAKRITFVAQNQVAGNAVQMWGGNSVNSVFEYIEADHCARAMELEGAGSGNVVKYGRATNSRLSPTWEPGPGMQYLDVA